MVDSIFHGDRSKFCHRLCASSIADALDLAEAAHLSSDGNDERSHVLRGLRNIQYAIASSRSDLKLSVDHLEKAAVEFELAWPIRDLRNSEAGRRYSDLPRPREPFSQDEGLASAILSWLTGDCRRNTEHSDKISVAMSRGRQVVLDLALAEIFRFRLADATRPSTMPKISWLVVLQTELNHTTNIVSGHGPTQTQPIGRRTTDTISGTVTVAV